MIARDVPDGDMTIGLLAGDDGNRRMLDTLELPSQKT